LPREKKRTGHVPGPENQVERKLIALWLQFDQPPAVALLWYLFLEVTAYVCRLAFDPIQLYHVSSGRVKGEEQGSLEERR
jgi:hypothetical protein